MKRYIIMAAAAMLTFRAAAQTLSLDECHQRALEHNKSLSLARTQHQQRLYDSKSYWANFFPQILVEI